MMFTVSNVTGRPQELIYTYKYTLLASVRVSDAHLIVFYPEMLSQACHP